MPLLPVRGVCSLIARNEGEVYGLVKDRSLAWAWNVAVTWDRGGRVCLRVLPAAVGAFMRGEKCLLGWPQVIEQVLPPGNEFTSQEISAALNVSGDHFYNLVKVGALELCQQGRRGPKGCALVRAASVIQFLRGRRR